MESKKKYILLFLIIAMGLGLSLAYTSTPSGALEVHFFDVGQGDAIFIETRNQRQVLIDAGEDADILEKLEGAVPFYDRHIDIIIATHMDKDHIGGMDKVLNRFDTDMVLVSQTETDSKESERFLATAKNLSLSRVKRGDILRLDEDTKLEILWPPADLPRSAKDNNLSVVTKLTYKKDCFIFTGDIEKATEIKLAQNTDLECEIMKAAHHGSKSSSNPYFVGKVNPELSVIQVGENSYGHPHRKVVKRLKNFGKVLRNDLNGDIIIRSYGNSF